MSNMRLVVFDMDGTLIDSQDVIIEAMDRAEALGIAAALERVSEHPLATVIVDAAREEELEIRTAMDAAAVPGYGLHGFIDGDEYWIGRPEWAGDLGATVSATMLAALVRADDRGDTAVVLISQRTVVAVFALADKVRSTAAAAIQSNAAFASSLTSGSLAKSYRLSTGAIEWPR